jgi:S-formylglutathione hydrolase
MPVTLEPHAFTCAEVPQPIEYAALVPDAAPAPLPLLYVLHGGGGSRDFLATVAPWLERAIDAGTIRPLVAVTPSVTARGFYMNFRDGSERWEDALRGPLLAHLRATFGLSTARAHTLLCGPSMGGMGSLRLAFKHPDTFGGVAALEPGIEPALAFDDIALADRFWRSDELFERAFGQPVDRAYWRANNPASIAADAPERLRAANLAIYLEAGDEDSFGLHRGTEFLHRVLFDAGIPHEYRLVRGADHIGASLAGRFGDAFAFLGRMLDPPPPDPILPPFRARMARMRRAAGLPD